MTRQKKSRKPGTLGAKSTPKNLRERKAPEPGKKPHKVKGRPAGNRHSIETKRGGGASGGSRSATDPRLGSKRKIPLTVPAPEAPKVAANPASSKPVEQPVNDDLKLAEDEFARLENDPKLQDLLAQMDAGDALSEDDQAWVDAQLDRYRQLADELGVAIDDYADEDDDEPLEPWQRFENPKDWV